MNDLNEKILEINPISILSGNCILCIFSIIINIIEVSIILYFKFLHSILYHLLLFMSLSEIVNCIFHIIQSILIMLNVENTFYIINSFIIYFTDTFSIILLGCLCDSMNVSILKHNKKISINQSYKLFSFIFSAVLTIICFIFYILRKDKDEKFIYTEFISWKFISNENLFQVNKLSINFFTYLITIAIYFLIISYSFFLIYRIYCFINEKSLDEAKKTKLNEFKIKMIKYPFFGILWISSLFLYSFSELFFGNNDNDIFSKVKIIKIKYFIYFIYCFISSLRGVLFFKLFISNEKIKKFIQLKIKSIIILDDIFDHEIEGNKSKDNYSINDNDNRVDEKNNLFQEGLIDDRDTKNNSSKDEDEKSDNENNSGSDDENLIKVSSATMNKNNIEEDLFQSLSSLSETTKDYASENKKKIKKNI